MARLKLNDGVSLKELGLAILELAAESDQSQGANREAGEKTIRDMFNGTNEGGDPANPDISFVYDTAEQVHLVVPDLSSKRGKPAASALDDYDLRDIAAEAMGEISVRGCGK
ncbi:hypothetical protein Q8W37_08545 [Shimia thalassica]|jgi:hypothetical protein|uniref:Uncharacterized protein n=1 Tax=Shimia thalassica TaxID=1715693 RepID=A0A0N7M801_9RHOB|nr:hypothetical protein [Shimia thalassica]PHO02688.1 hypothetical protein CSC82_19475 [Rhodobacteraceae bacterium 4F10]MBU2941078.1 hypothetical protein [Shimia thalassica]MDO6485709.1 hypothetical protein [Shimia thalassica]MDO6503438.1 hypothetical protein [Shimia thalassica]MDO6800355.1 hypothetical protein [Shimia thalassica]